MVAKGWSHTHARALTALALCLTALSQVRCAKESEATRPAESSSPPQASRPPPVDAARPAPPEATAPPASASPQKSAEALAAPAASADKKRDPYLLGCCRVYSVYEMCNTTPCPPGIGKFYAMCMKLYQDKRSLREALPDLKQVHEKHVRFPMLPACNPDFVKSPP